MATDEALSYLTEGRQILKNKRLLHLALDGVSAGGEENLFYIFWIRGKRAVIAPEQVFRRVHFSKGIFL